MYKSMSAVAMALTLVAGCASVPMESKDKSAKAKEFSAPSSGKAGLYIYRTMGAGTALKKDIWVDGKCVGESAQSTFFYQEVDGGVPHKVSTESEFSPNDLIVNTEAGKNYYLRQYIKMGLFVGGANLELVNDQKAKSDIASLDLAVPGKCSQ